MTNAPDPPVTDGVAQVIASYPREVRDCFLQVRGMVFETAGRLDVGPLLETLKWGEPAYLTAISKTGTTLRLAWKPAYPGQLGLYVNCQTPLIEAFRTEFPTHFCFTGNRGVLIACSEPLPEQPLIDMIAATLTYHRNKQTSGSEPLVRT